MTRTMAICFCRINVTGDQKEVTEYTQQTEGESGKEVGHELPNGQVGLRSAALTASRASVTLCHTINPIPSSVRSQVAGKGDMWEAAGLLRG